MINDKTELYAYVIGLFCADGNIYKNQMSIVSKDRILCEICQKLFNKQIIQRKDGIFRIRFKNTEWLKNLLDIGIKRRKSYTLGLNNVFKNIVKSNKRHFIRGFLDGDGSVQTSGSRYGINFYNTDKMLLISIARFLKVKNYKIIQKKNKKTPLFQLSIYNKENFFKVYHCLYDNSKYFLPRKEKYFIDVKSFEFKNAHLGIPKSINHRKALSLARINLLN
jgi:hypothetical protein